MTDDGRIYFCSAVGCRDGGLGEYLPASGYAISTKIHRFGPASLSSGDDEVASFTGRAVHKDDAVIEQNLQKDAAPQVFVIRLLFLHVHCGWACGEIPEVDCTGSAPRFYPVENSVRENSTSRELSSN